MTFVRCTNSLVGACFPFEVLRLPGPSANASAGRVTPVARLHVTGLHRDCSTTCRTSQLELLWDCWWHFAKFRPHWRAFEDTHRKRVQQGSEAGQNENRRERRRRKNRTDPKSTGASTQALQTTNEVTQEGQDRSCSIPRWRSGSGSYAPGPATGFVIFDVDGAPWGAYHSAHRADAPKGIASAGLSESGWTRVTVC